MAWDEDIRARFPDWGTDAALRRWPTVKLELAVGQAVSGEVIARAPFGVWVDIGVSLPALLLVPERTCAHERPIPFEKYPEVGTLVKARVVSLGDRAEIGLSQNAQFSAG